MCNYCMKKTEKEAHLLTELRALRLQKKLTQQEAAKRIGVSLRSYVMYENDPGKTGTPKYRFLLQELDRIAPWTKRTESSPKK